MLGEYLEMGDQQKMWFPFGFHLNHSKTGILTERAHPQFPVWLHGNKEGGTASGGLFWVTCDLQSHQSLQPSLWRDKNKRVHGPRCKIIISPKLLLCVLVIYMLAHGVIFLISKVLASQALGKRGKSSPSIAQGPRRSHSLETME